MQNTKQKRLEMKFTESQYSLGFPYFLKDSRVIRVVVVSEVDHPLVGPVLSDPGQCCSPSQREEREFNREKKKEGEKLKANELGLQSVLCIMMMRVTRV